MYFLSVISLLSIFAFSATVHGQQTAYGQCGGNGWTGPTTCVSGYTCVYSNDWYSQCIPGSTTPTSTTSVKPTSTTAAVSTSTPVSTSYFKNPLKTSNGSDPFMVYSNGYYYLITTTWSNLQLTRGRTLAELKASSPKTIWQDSTSSRCCNYWAGEIHSIGGVWYIYYTAGTSGANYDNQRLHVIKASSTDLWASTWSYAGRLAFPNRDIWSIDGSVLKLNGNNYIIYSGQDTGGQCLFIAQLTSPTTVGNAYILSRPTLSWEQVGYSVNEGPVALYKNGRTWITYSASLCSGTGYKLGLLEYTSGDPLNINSWKKYSQPVLQSANGNYQPGHNGFFLSPSGQQWIVFHANSVTPGQCDGSRYTMAQPVEWNSDGTPRFQAPAPLSSNIPEPV